MKLAFAFIVSLFLGVVGYIALDQISEHYRIAGAQDFARLQAKSPPPLSPADCLKLSASVKGRQYRIGAENICNARTPQTELLVKFYDQQRVRIGVAAGLLEGPAIAPMDAGEKMTHEFDIPADVWKQNTTPVSAKVEVAQK